jgi:hypothetical protein
MAPAPDPVVERLLASVAAIPRIPPASPKQGLSPAPPRSPGLGADDAPAPSTRYHQGHFGARHHLTPEQAWLAEQLLRQKKPFHGPHAQQKEAARIAGIVSSVRNGRVQNSRWGRKMLATRGGRVLAMHGLGHLRAIGRRGSEAAKAARERKKAMVHFETTGQVLGLEPHEPGDVGQLPPLDAWQERPFLMW